jgi:hypothetical protein
VFVSYSRKDKEWLDRLKANLKPLVRKGALNVWDDTRIRAGEEWRAEIDQALARATVVVLLVSSDFLASEFIADVELPAILKAAQQGALKVIWIPIRPSVFAETELGKYQAAWDPKRPLSGLKSAARETALVQICGTVMDAVARYGEPPPPAISNPFVWRAGITEGEAFFNRERELAMVRDFLNKRQSVQVVGPRRIGKTSLLLHVRRIAQTWNNSVTVAYLDSQDPRCATLEGWLRRLAKQLKWDQAPGDLEGLADRTEAMLTGGSHPVVCLDEVEELIWRPGAFSREFFLTLRSLGQTGLSILTAGRTPLSQLMDQSDTDKRPATGCWMPGRAQHRAPAPPSETPPKTCGPICPAGDRTRYDQLSPLVSVAALPDRILAQPVRARSRGR